MTRTSISYLEEALEKMGDMPDSRKAERLKMSPQALWNHRKGVSKMDNYACIMVGRYLGIDPMKIIAACEEERTKSQEKQEFWRDFRSTLGVAAVAPLAAMMMMTTPQEAHAKPTEPSMTNVYYVKYRRRNGRHFRPNTALLRIVFRKIVQEIRMCHFVHNFQKTYA